MKALLPPSVAKKLPAFFTQEHVADPMVQVKLFTPRSSWTWYLIEYDPRTRVAFGLCCGFEDELGYVGLDELEALNARRAVPAVERDLHFKPTRLSAIRAERAGAE